MEAAGNLLHKYFYTRDGELSQAGSAVITGAFTALGWGALKIGTKVWQMCTGEGEGGLPNEFSGHRLHSLFTLCTQKLISSVSYGANKSYEFVTSPTGMSLAAVTGLFKLLV